MPWYKFKPGGAPPNVGDPNQYISTGSTPPNCPTPKLFLCAIQAADNMGKPIITTALILEIANALQRTTDSTNVKLCSTNPCPCTA